MEHLNNTIGSISKEILKNFTKKEGSTGKQIWDLRKDIDWQQHIVMESYGNRTLCPEAYASVFRILLEIYIAESRDEAEEFLQNIEPYDTIPELTAWLDSSPQNIEYLNKALSTDEHTNGLEILECAHRLFLQEIGLSLISSIYRHIEQPVLQFNATN